MRPAPLGKACVLLCSSCCDDVHNATATGRAELDCTGSQSEQRVISTAANACAGVEVGSTLADDDLASLDYLTAEALNTQVLSVGITTVASGARTLFMCHLKCLPFRLRLLVQQPQLSD